MHDKIATFKKLLDVVLTCLAFICAYFLKQNLFFPLGGLTTAPNYYIVLLMIVIIWYAVLSIIYPYDRKERRIRFATIYNIFKSATVGVAILAFALFLFKITDFSRLLIVFFYLLDILFLAASRWLIYAILFPDAGNKQSKRHILILGSWQTAREIIQNILRDEQSAIEVIGCIETDRSEVGKEVAGGIQIIGTLEDIKEILTNRVVDEVLIAMPLNKIENSEWYLSFINTFGITTRIIPHWYIRKFMASRPSFYDVDFENFLTEPAMVLSTSLEKTEELLFKRLFDYSAALVGLLLTLPLFPLIAAAIKLASPGPVFYRQRRCGLYGRRFDVYKFRTMVVDAEKRLPELLPYNEATGVVFKMKNDPRIIPYVGHFLRKTSLDELPQLLNVLKGEMSIVGPRPPIPDEVDRYELWQRRRLAMRPGITCLWQIQKNRNDMSFDEWMELDLQYTDNWSLWLDLKIIWWTLPAVLFGQGR